MSRFLVESLDVRIAGEVFEPPDGAAAPTIVLVHGYPDTSSLWAPVVERLRATCRVVTYDVRGAGASEAPKSAAGYRLEHLMADLRAVIDHVSPDAPVHLVGHDWGAIQGWEAVSRDDLAPRIASFTALSAPSFDAAGRWIRERLRRPSRAALGDLAAQARRSWYVAAFQAPGLPELLWRALAPRWQRVLSRLDRLSPEVARPPATLLRDAVNGLELYRANLGRVLAPQSGPVKVPTQVVTGADDPFVSPRLFADLPPEIGVHVLTGAGHWLPKTHPELAQLVTRHLEAAIAGRVRAPASHATATPLRPRKRRYDWTSTAACWIPGDPYASHTIDALSLLLPAGERWFVRVFKQALPLVRDATLADEVRGFMGQEAAHAVAHAALLEQHLGRRGIVTAPFTDRVEHLFERVLADHRLPPALARAWLRGRVAVIASIEHYTAILGQWILEARALDEAGADREMLALLRWHGAEEVEHAHVAFDLHRHLYGAGSDRAPLARILARLELSLLHVLFVTPLFIGLILAGASHLMHADPGVSPDAPRGLAAFRAAAARGHLPRLGGDFVRPGLALLDPAFHPLQHVDRERARAVLQEDVRRHG